MSASILVLVADADFQPLLNLITILGNRGELGALDKVIVVSSGDPQLHLYPEYGTVVGDLGISFSVIDSSMSSMHTTWGSVFDNFDLDSDDFIIPLDLTESIDVRAIRRILSLAPMPSADSIACIQSGLSEVADEVIQRPDMLLLPWLLMGAKMPSSNFALCIQLLGQVIGDVPLSNDFSVFYDVFMNSVFRQNSEVSTYSGSDLLAHPGSRWRRKPNTWKSPNPQLYKGIEDKNPQFKVLIVGDLGQYHHHKIFYTCYLDLPINTKFSYSLLTPEFTEFADFAVADLVIISRLPPLKFYATIQKCREFGLPSIYMLDDNWFSLGDDYPSLYEDLFSLDGEDMFIMRRCLAEVSSLLVYSPVLAADLRPINPRVELMKPSVDITRFELTERPEHEGFVIGFAGSLRFQDAAFEAMANVARSRDDVEIVVMGTLSADQQRLFTGLRFRSIPFASYERYIATIRELGADLLIAPLGDSHSEASKVINKYLEITAAGAAGVYSSVLPYTTCVEDGVNGWLVEDFDSARAWESTILAALNSGRIEEVASEAQRDVRENYSIEKAAPLVCRKLLGYMTKTCSLD